MNSKNTTKTFKVSFMNNFAKKLWVKESWVVKQDCVRFEDFGDGAVVVESYQYDYDFFASNPLVYQVQEW